MLSKENCKQAINAWEITRHDYSKIDKLINPVSVFSFNRTQIDWLNKNNNNSRFHTYIGVHNDELILITVPLDKNGKEVNLTSYSTSILTPLQKELTLVETDVVTTIKKTTLSKNLKVTNYCEEIKLPTYNEPTITERASVDDIEKWKNECLDWFYNECNNFKGQRVFRTFTVPFADLVKKDEKYDGANVFFGFKHSSIYQRQIPVLIFVAINSKSSEAKIIRSTTLDTEATTNTDDYSHPCPPMCIDSADYVLLANN